MRGDPEAHDDNSMSAATDDPVGVRYEVRAWAMDGKGVGLGLVDLLGSRPKGILGRAWDAAHRVLGPPEAAPGQHFYRVFAEPVGGDVDQRRATLLQATSVNDALLRGLELIESGSFPQPGEPTYL